ncbi:phage minor head protein [Arthrobacter burdickii]|uniref:Phage minor head protein n=1 Tax=Arthrobacter burdickii TaxID=3035920 RepID=A0ABT8K382_9MICC|nr:phage minor head protein [Arthrobacter burdickii]MDN4611473.1 phage minor head protein [Arthrobacter burdickii]
MRQAYDFAKNGAADELKVPAPSTNRDTTALINQSAQSVVDKQFGDLLFIIKSEVLKELRKNTLSETNLGLSDILGAIGDAFNSFFDSKLSLTGAIVISQAVNRGRQDVFENYRAKISVYQYSAILDDRTCPICEDLDGTVVDYAGYWASKWEPPVHGNCRCLWVGVGAEQTEQPDITGFPKAPGGVSKPQL